MASPRMTAVPNFEASGSGRDVAERQRFADIRARAADQGYVLREVRTGFMRRDDGRLLHRNSIEGVAMLLTARRVEGKN